MAGWQDGEVRAHRVPTGELVWTLANVHKGVRGLTKFVMDVATTGIQMDLDP